VRAIVLDTVNRAAAPAARSPTQQVAWLRAELARAGRRWIVVVSHNPLASSDGGTAALAALDEAPRVGRRDRRQHPSATRSSRTSPRAAATG
jgi:hypothetical protein